MKKRRNAVDIPAPHNTRANARRLFPECSREFQARWVLATLQLRSHSWRHPIGNLALDDPNKPDFLRTLPPHTYLDVQESAVDRVRKGLRYVKGFAR